MDEHEFLEAFAPVPGLIDFYNNHWNDNQRVLVRNLAQAAHAAGLDMYYTTPINVDTTQIRIGAKEPGATRGNNIALVNIGPVSFT